MIWTFNSTKKITRSQKTNPEFKKQIPRFSVIAHISFPADPWLTCSEEVTKKKLSIFWKIYKKT
jgi:hypothetical protein